MTGTKHLNVLIFFFILIFTFQGCNKKNEQISSDFFLSENLYTFDQSITSNDERLPVSVIKLRQYIGTDFEPVGYKVFNSKKSNYEDLIFCYKEKPTSNVKIVIFSVLPNEILRKQFEYQTTISEKKDFSIQVSNLFFEDDSYILIEGIDEQDNRSLYIFSNNSNDNFSLIQNFSATYSIFYDFTEKDYEGAKYFVLKNIVLLNNALSATNTTIQRKDIFIWDYNVNSFKLSESSQIVPQSISDISSEILYSSENYFNFIRGFWYSEKYKEMIDNNNINPDNFERDSIKYAYFSEKNGLKQVHINYGDYADIYTIDKIIKMGGQKPGLRLTLKDPVSLNIVDYRYVDLFLFDNTLIKVKGPEDYDYESYVRLPKPFIEYINEVRSINKGSEIEKFKQSLNGTYTNSEFVIEFKQNQFRISKDTITDTGEIKLEKKDEIFILFFLFKTENRILDKKYFIIDKINDERVILISVKPTLNGYVIENNRPVTLTKKNIDNSTNGI